MARTIRHNPNEGNPRHIHPSKRARKTEKRTARQDERRALREYVR